MQWSELTATTSEIDGSSKRIESSPNQSPRLSVIGLVDSKRGRGAVGELTVHAPFGLAVEDDVEAGADEALALRPLSGLEPLLLERLPDVVELGRGQVCEQRHARKFLSDVDLARHAHLLSFRASLHGCSGIQ